MSQPRVAKSEHRSGSQCISNASQKYNNRIVSQNTVSVGPFVVSFQYPQLPPTEVTAKRAKREQCNRSVLTNISSHQKVESYQDKACHFVFSWKQRLLGLHIFFLKTSATAEKRQQQPELIPKTNYGLNLCRAAYATSALWKSGLPRVTSDIDG